MPARTLKAACLILALSAASILAARITLDNDQQRFECTGGNSYVLNNFNADQEDGECFTFYARLSTEASGKFNVKPLRNILPISDPSLPIVHLTVYPKALDDGRPKGLEGVSIATIEFDKVDGLSAAPAPLAPGYYIGNPDIRKEPEGNPLLFGCTNYNTKSASYNSNECRTTYRLDNGDTLSYSVAGIKGQRPTDWANIDRAIRDLIEAAERSALSIEVERKT